MPEGFGYGRSRRRGIDLTIPSLDIRRPETAPPEDLVAYWPDTQQIEQAREEYQAENEMPWWARVLSAPSNLLGREAVTRGLEAGGKDGIGAGIVAAAEGYGDSLMHLFGLIPGMKVTNFSDIRKAWGQTEVEEGGANFAINLIGDILTDPAMVLSPLGFISKAHNASTMISRGLTIEKAVKEGIRGGLVFRIPIIQDTGFDIIEAMAKLPLPYFDKFTSMNVQFAKGMDHLFGFLRTNPVTGPLLQRLGAVPIADPETAAWVKKSHHDAGLVFEQYRESLLKKFRELDDEMKGWIAKHDKDSAYAVVDLLETNLRDINNNGLVTDYLRRLPEHMRNQEFARHFKADAKFKQLWMTAAKGGDDSVKAIRTLYDNYDYWLPKKWLDMAGKTARIGIEIKGPDTMAGAISSALKTSGLSVSEGEAARWMQTVEARSAGEIGQDAFRAQQTQARLDRWKRLWDDIQNGKVKREEIEKLLAVHHEAMDTIAAADKAAGVLNSTLEPYFPRVLNPALKRWVDKQQIKGLGAFKFAGDASFAKTRKITDMTTTEAQAFLMEIGTKATGFQGMNVPIEQFKREMAEHGPWAVMKYMFPKQWINKLNRVDEELGSFFLANPILADVWRINRSAEIQYKTHFWKSLLHPDSPIVLDEASGTDPAKLMELYKVAGLNGWELMIDGERGSLPRVADIGDGIADQVGKDMRARVGIAENVIRKEIAAAMDDSSTMFDDRLTQLREVNKITSKSDLSYTPSTPFSEMAVKRGVQGRLEAAKKLRGEREALSALEDEARAARQELTGSAKAERNKLQAQIDSLIEMADDDRAAIELAKEGPVDWDQIDKWQAESSKHVESLLEGEKMLAAARTAKRKIKTGKPGRQIDVGGRVDTFGYDDLLLGAKQRVLAAAEDLVHARAQEFSARAAVKHVVGQLETAQHEVLAQRISGLEAKREATLAAMERIRKNAIKAEMMSNEQKMWWKFRDTGRLGLDELPPDARDNMLRKGGKFRLVAVQKGTMEAATKFQNMLHAPDPLKGNPFINGFDRMKSWFLGMTVMHPIFVKTRMADFLGGTITQMQAGLWSPTAHALGGKIAYYIGKAAKEGKPADTYLGEVIKRTSDGATVTLADFARAGQHGGLLGADLVNDSVAGALLESTSYLGSGGKNVWDWVGGFFGAKMPENNPVLRVGQKFARLGDDTVRASTMIGAWLKGGTLDDAVASAKHWTYGSGKDFTSFERHFAKRMIPLYGFMKWATTRSAELWLNKPGTLTWISHMRENAMKMNGMDPTSLNAAMPKFINDGIGIPVVNTEEGPKMYLFGNILPLGSALDLVGAISGIVSGQGAESLRYIGQNMHPALKSMLEASFNYDFFQGREIEKFPGDTREVLGVEMPSHYAHVLKNWFRGLAALDRLNVFNAREMKVVLDAVRRGDVIGTRKELPFLERWFSSAFGPMPATGYQVDIEEELRHRRAQHTQEMGRYKASLRRSVNEGKVLKQEALQEVIADEIAEIEARQKVAADYAINEAASRKVRLVR